MINLANKIKLALILICFSFDSMASSKPVLFYSDLAAGPKNGWSKTEPSKGAVVTVWGRNLGDFKSAGTYGNYITVGGVHLTDLKNYAEEWGEEAPVPGIQKISFWLTNDMPKGLVDISVTVDGVISNKLPFMINSGRLVFIDNSLLPSVGYGTHENPYSSPSKALGSLKAGDILYFKSGVYNLKYWEGGENIWARPTAPKGTKENPIAFVAYPKATPIFDSLSAKSSSFHTGIRIDVPWYTVSKLTFVSYASAIIASGENARIVANDVDGGNIFRFGIGVITAARDGVKVFGNRVHGGETGNRLDHAIYLSGCSPNEGIEVGYNYIHDNNFGAGPMIVVNHQDERCSPDVRLAAHKIYSNFIDCQKYPSRAIGLYDQSWDPKTDSSGEPEPTYVFNNITHSCGDKRQPVFYQNSAHGRWYNNTLYNSLGNGLSVSGERVLSTEIINNIFHMKLPNLKYFNVTNGKYIVTNNLYYGAGPDNGLDAKPVNLDPNMYVTPYKLEARLWPTSPAINAGSLSTMKIVNLDYKGRARVTADIGAAAKTEIIIMKKPSFEPQMQ